MRKLIALAAAVVVAVAAVPAFAATKTVRVDDNVFRPDSMTGQPGDTVRFRWVGDSPAQRPQDERPELPQHLQPQSGTVSRKLTRRGTLRLVCTIHPGMDMRIRVR